MDNSTPPNETDVPVLGDKVYGMKVDKYMVTYKEVRAKKISWIELNANIYNFCLQHNPLDLESVLKSNSRWDTIMADHDIIGLFHVVRDITHKQDEKM